MFYLYIYQVRSCLDRILPRAHEKQEVIRRVASIGLFKG